MDNKINKNVLIIGANGYVGPLVCDKFIRESYNVTVIDDNWFLESNKLSFSKDFTNNSKKINWINYDVRSFKNSTLINLGEFETVIYLAAVSNDPIGKDFSIPTHHINSQSAIELAENCKDSGVKNFLFASSCSVYGGGDGSRPVHENDKTDPLTDYSQSKLSAEIGLQKISSSNFKVGLLRFATAGGPSVNMRYDLVLNDFVYSAIKNNFIEIKSNGKPFRPIINTLDMANGFFNVLNYMLNSNDHHVVFNVGFNNWNFQVLELAEYVQKVLGNNIDIKVDLSAADDKRSYCVNFDKYSSISKNILPEMTIDQVINKTSNITEQVISLVSLGVLDYSHLKRHSHLKSLIDNKYMSKNLNWI